MNFYKVFDVKSHFKTKNDILKDIEDPYSGRRLVGRLSSTVDYLSFISKSNWDQSDSISPTPKMCWPYFL